jgi:hypothetical protein
MAKKFYIVGLLAGAFLVAAAGCKAPRQDEKFEKKFEQAKKQSGLSKVDVIAVGNGKELQTNVQRVGDPTPPKGVDVGQTLPATLTHSVVARVIRRRVSRLRYCLLGGAVKGRSGKAVITLSIGRSGEVSTVKVSAPAFRGTNLSSCVKSSAKLWRFPKFRKGTITHSYPVIFRGR